MTSTSTPTSTFSTQQMGGKRKLSKWNKFTSKVYATEHRKNKNFKFKDALKMASAMKKKGQYGGEGEEDGTFSTVPLTTTPEEGDSGMGDVGEDGSLATSQVGQLLAPAGGRRRRRTMRRSRGRSQRRSRGRSRGRGRARASRRH